MKALKLTILLIMAIIVLFLIIPVFLPGHVDVSGSIDIKAKAETVFRQVNVLKNRKQWSPFESDTSLTDTYEGPAQGVGAQYSWKGQQMNTGSIRILKSEQNSYIKTDLNFGQQGKGVGEWHFKQDGNRTNVSWRLQLQSLQYPFGKWLGLFMPKMMKKVIDKGLKQLKAVAERGAQAPDTIPN